MLRHVLTEWAKLRTYAKGQETAYPIKQTDSWLSDALTMQSAALSANSSALEDFLWPCIQMVK